MKAEDLDQAPAIALQQHLHAGRKFQRLHRLRSRHRRDRRMGTRDRQPPARHRAAIFGTAGKPGFAARQRLLTPERIQRLLSLSSKFGLWMRLS